MDLFSHSQVFFRQVQWELCSWMASMATDQCENTLGVEEVGGRKLPSVKFWQWW